MLCIFRPGLQLLRGIRALLLLRHILQVPLFSTPESFRKNYYFFAAFAIASSVATKSAATLNWMNSQATWSFLSTIMV